MTSKAGTALDYGTTAPKHAVKSHGTTTYTYDANGSMTARGTQTIKYDPEQRPIRIQDGTSVHRAVYDGDGVRRKREDSNGTVHYLGGYERKLAAGANAPEAVTKYYSASFGAMSRPVAFRRGGTLHWVGSDHLGGTIRVLNDSFAALDGMRYKPFGEDRDTGTSLNTDRKFTGQTEDEAAGLYWYASRAYDPAIGRFVSPDPIVPAPGNPQSLNRYSYAYNNPLRYTDPTGHYNVEDDKDWLREFEQKNKGNAPTASDKAFRQASMEAALQGQAFSVEYWAGLLERAASNAAHSEGPAASNAADPVSPAASSAADPVSPAASNKRSQTYHYPQKALYRNKAILDAHYNTPTDLRPPERHYYVSRLDGTTITVREYVRGWRERDLRRLRAQAAVLTPLEIWSQGELEYGSKLYLHEEQHVNQMQEMGELWYKTRYTLEFVGGLFATGFDDPLEAHRIHSMEVDANRRAGLPDYWRQSGEEDWRAP